MSLQCTNPQHPQGLPKEMIFLQERDSAYVFGCPACRDINRKLSIHVITSQRLKAETRKSLAAQGRLMTEAPRTITPQMRAPQSQSQPISWDDTHRRSKDGRFELIHYRALPNGNLQLQMAIDGHLAPMMDDHIASREEFPTDEQYFSRVARASELMLHLYGDARAPLTPEESEHRQHQTF